MSTEKYLYRRTWTTKHGEKKSCWVVRWTDGLKKNGRAVMRERGGFLTRDLARAFYNRHVKPALAAGYTTPWEQAAEEEKNRTTVDAWFTSLCEKQPVNYKNSDSFKNLKKIFRDAIQSFGALRLIDTINTTDIEEFITSDTRNGSPSQDTVRKRFFSLRSAFQGALKQGKLAINPCDGIKLPPPGRGRTRFLTLTEARSLLAAALKTEQRTAVEIFPTFLYAMICTGLYTGQRPDEVLHLEWTDIYSDSARVMVQAKQHWRWSPKNGKPRPIGANSDLYIVLDQYKADRQQRLRDAETRLQNLKAWAKATEHERKTLSRPSDLAKYQRPPSLNVLIERARGVVVSLREQISSPLVFPNREGKPLREIPDAFAAAVSRAGLGPEVTFYTLRHTFASQLVQAGVDLPTVKELMGHASIVTTMRYAHLAPGHGVDKGGLIPTLTDTAKPVVSGTKHLHITGKSS